MKRYFLSLFVCLLAVGGALPSAAQNMYRERLPEEFSPTIDSWDSNGGWNTQSYPINRLVDGNMGTEIRGNWNKSSSNITFSPSNRPIKGMRCRTATTNYIERPTGIMVQSSTDKQNWQTVYNSNVSRYQTEWIINFTNHIPAGRYIRVTFYCGNEWHAFIYMNELTFSSSSSSADFTIHHKRAKWYSRRGRISDAAKDMDSFSDDEEMFRPDLSSSDEKIQAAHTYIDTLYVHKGDAVNLYLPDVYRKDSESDISNFSISSYQRWYSYRTGMTFELPHKDIGTTARHDLLTPLDGQTIYRFANGYVGQPVNTIGNANNLASAAYQMQFYYPTDDEFNRWVGAGSGIDNNWYVVACDVSSYTDFTPGYTDDSHSSTFFPSSNADGKVYEPTLTHRVVFYIVGVDGREKDQSEGWANGFGRLKNEAYRNDIETGQPDSKKYLEEYEITFSARRVSNKTLDLVALSKDAGSYAIPDAENDSYDQGYKNISVSLVDNTAGIILADERFSKPTLRTIRFRYPHPDTDTGDGTQYVNDADGDGVSHATILVTKTATVDGVTKTYNLARYRLTFIDEVQPLTQVQVDEIEKAARSDTATLDKYWNYAHRTPEYMESNYQLLTSMAWDFDTGVAGEAGFGSNSYYPFPLGWERSSYSFYDGSNGSNFSNNNKFPEWGYYAVTSTYVDFDNNWHHGTATRPKNEPSKGSSTFHIYVDASDRPGIVTRLPFEQDLCRGSELFVSAWVKSAVSANAAATQTNNEDACLLFTIMGVRTVTSGGRTSQVYTPIYRYSTGQLHSSTFLSDSIPGCGKGIADQWFQVYFTFINEQENSDYDSYVLQVENNSYSTSGGDFYLDDVRVYMVKPRADVVQLRAGCAGERTLMSARIDWDRLSSRLGHEDTDKGVEGIDFVFVDQTIYNNYLAEHPEDKAAALKAAAAMIGPEKGSELYDKNHGTLYFKYPFSENKVYNGTAEDPDLAKDNMEDGKAYFYRRGTAVGGNRELVVDFFSDLKANRPYWMLIRVHDDNNGTELLFEELAAVVDDRCAIKSDFWVTAETLLKMNGETVKPGTNYCAGQILDFSAQVRIPYISKTGEEKYISVNEGIYFDWFFGTEDAFYKDRDGTSVQSALARLRELYPTAEDISPETTPVVENGLINFSQADYDLLHDLSTREPEAGGNPPLVLRRAHLNIELLETGLQLVIQPITTQTAPGSIELPDDAPQNLDSLWLQVCWAPVPMTLQADGKSPTVHAGFNRYNYPDPAYDPNLRIGLAQIKSTTSAAPLRIDLRGATFSVVDPDPSSELVPITSNENERGRLVYLIGTNDPEYEDIVNSPDFSQYAYPIGYVDEFTAQPYEQGSAFDDHVSIHFYLNGEGEPKDGFVFNPKEGYWYTFSVHFKELLAGETSTACYGKFALRMNVVPEYLVWDGGPTNNWNRDENWKRVNSRTTIHATDDSFLDGNTTERAFVPMLFSKVLIPRGQQVQLYRAGWRTGSDGHYGWESQRPEWMQSPTDSIQYDLMAYDDPAPAAEHKLVTKPYRVALCKEIHFEPGAEMLHAEYLLTERVWTDVEVPAGRWTPVSTPLQGVYAGDWYTQQTSGRQTTEYFKRITFSDDYDRLHPAVYQRSWNADAANIVEDAQGTRTPVSFKTVWSSAFNDASVPYSVGSGFSLKHGVDVDGGALFRLPKDDESYSVATGALDRRNNGVLLSTKMVHRDPDMEKTEIEKFFTAELTPSADRRYYIVGNPFVAQMDVAGFLKDNEKVLQQKYWAVTAAGDPMTAAADEGGQWVTSTGTTQLLPPYGAFYVEAVDGVDGPLTVEFHGERQQLKNWPASGTGTTQAAAMTVSCASAAGTSTAAVRCTPDAADGFGVGDVQLVRGLTADVSQPTVYTVAGATAVTVDSRGRGGQVPLGVYAPDGMVSTLTFTGVAALEGARLYDAQTRSERTLHEGDAVTVDGPSHGRYFLRFDGAGTTGIATTTPAAGANIYSVQPGEIIVAATETLTGVDVYTTDGRHVRSLRPADVTTLRIKGLPAGVYVVRAATDHTTANAKVSVR